MKDLHEYFQIMFQISEKLPISGSLIALLREKSSALGHHALDSIYHSHYQFQRANCLISIHNCPTRGVGCIKARIVFICAIIIIIHAEIIPQRILNARTVGDE